MRQDKCWFTMSLVVYRERRNQPVTPHEGEMQPPPEAIREYQEDTTLYLQSQEWYENSLQTENMSLLQFLGTTKAP